MKKPVISIWTTSQYPYDQRVQRIVHTMKWMGAEVKVWDRRTQKYGEGKIETEQERGPAFYFQYNRQIARLVNEEPSDMIYAADIDVMPGLMWGLFPGVREGNPILLDLHEWFPEVFELQKKPLRKFLWRCVERGSVHFATSLMTVNHSLKQVFEDKYHREFAVIRNVPEMRPTHCLDTDLRKKNRILYYQGALNAGRGLEVVIRSLHLLPDWQIWLVGEGDIGEYLKELSIAEGLRDRVIFHGRIPPDELPALAGQATLGMNLLSNQSQSYYYSLANRYFDYIHSGLPSVHMDFPEYRKLMQEFEVGLLIDALSPQVLVDAIMKITGDTGLYHRYVEQCSVARTEYNWKSESDNLIELLKSMPPFK